MLHGRAGVRYRYCGVRNARKAASAPDAKAAKTILVPIDFSDSSKQALRHAMGLTRHLSRILLVHVIAPSDSAASAEPINEKLLTFARSCGLDHQSSPRALVRTGTPFQEILESATENAAELIVLGVRDSASSAGLGLGHTAERVSRYANCPVLLVRPDENSKPEKAPPTTLDSARP